MTNMIEDGGGGGQRQGQDQGERKWKGKVGGLLLMMMDESPP